MCSYKRDTLHGNADCENEPSRKNLKIEEPAEDARRSGERTELVDGLVPRCAGQEAEAPNKEVMCGEGRSELVDGLDPLRTWPADQSLGVGSGERPPEWIRAGSAPTLVPSVLTARPPERASLYHPAGENQHSTPKGRAHITGRIFGHPKGRAFMSTAAILSGL